MVNGGAVVPWGEPGAISNWCSAQVHYKYTMGTWGLVGACRSLRAASPQGLQLGRDHNQPTREYGDVLK